MYLDNVTDRYKQFDDFNIKGFYVALQDTYGTYYHLRTSNFYGGRRQKVNIGIENHANEVFKPQGLRCSTYGDYYTEGFHAFACLEDAKRYIKTLSNISYFDYAILYIDMYDVHTVGLLDNSIVSVCNAFIFEREILE